MSTTYHQTLLPATDRLIDTKIGNAGDLEQRRREAARARRLASECGDYAAAESWYRQERALADALLAEHQAETQG